MKKKIIVLSILFILSLLCFAPAKLIENFLPQQTNVSVAGFNGTLWSGEIKTIQAYGLTFKDTQYSFNALSLFSFSPSYNIELSDGDILGDFDLEFLPLLNNNINLASANLDFFAEILEKELPMKNISLEGKIISHNIDFFSKQAKPEYIEGKLEWNNASVSAFNQNFKLGDFGLEFSTDEKTKNISGKILETNNSLSLKGKFNIDNKGFFEVTGSVATDIEQGLYNTMLFFADGKAANGRLPIKFKQKIF